MPPAMMISAPARSAFVARKTGGHSSDAPRGGTRASMSALKPTGLSSTHQVADEYYREKIFEREIMVATWNDEEELRTVPSCPRVRRPQPSTCSGFDLPDVCRASTLDQVAYQNST
jgi:hypothetical protein